MLPPVTSYACLHSFHSCHTSYMVSYNGGIPSALTSLSLSRKSGKGSARNSEVIFSISYSHRPSTFTSSLWISENAYCLRHSLFSNISLNMSVIIIPIRLICQEQTWPSLSPQDAGHYCLLAMSVNSNCRAVTSPPCTQTYNSR